MKLLNDHYDREIGIQRAASKSTSTLVMFIPKTNTWFEVEEATPSPITTAPSESSISVSSGRSKLKVSELLNFSVPEVRPPNVGAIFDPSPNRSMD